MRLAEVVGALSLAADVSSGLAMEKGLRTVLVATRLAKLLGVDAEAQATVFWVSALRFVGCTAFATEEAAIAAGDDNSMRHALVFADFAQPLDVVQRVVRGLAPEAAALERAGSIARFLLDRDIPRRYAKAHCESALFFARSLGMSDDVARGLDVTGERWDGRGLRGLGGNDLPMAARVADVADVLELFAWTGGPELCRAVLEARAGATLDPTMVDTAIEELPELLEGLGSGSVWEEYLAAEPAPLRASADEVDRGCVALGRFSNLRVRSPADHLVRAESSSSEMSKSL